MSITDSRLVDGNGNPLQNISCSVFNQINKDNKSQLLNYYLQKPLGLDEYYNKLIICTDKNKSIYEKRLKMIMDPRYMNNTSKNSMEKLKTEEKELRLKIRQSKKILKNICTEKKKLYCRFTKKKINKIRNSKIRKNNKKIQQFDKLRDGINICNKDNICKDFRISLSNIPSNTRFFYKKLQKTFLSPLIKNLKKNSYNTNNTQNVNSMYYKNSMKSMAKTYNHRTKTNSMKSKKSVKS